MKLGACLNCSHHEDCTFQRVFPVRECDEFEELDLSPELDRNLADVLKEWGLVICDDEHD